MLEGQSIDDSLVLLAGKTAAAEVVPIDDIRSTARYRSAVVANLIAEFLEKLGGWQRGAGAVLARWNALDVRRRGKRDFALLRLARRGLVAWRRAGRSATKRRSGRRVR